MIASVKLNEKSPERAEAEIPKIKLVKARKVYPKQRVPVPRTQTPRTEHKEVNGLIAIQKY